MPLSWTLLIIATDLTTGIFNWNNDCKSYSLAWNSRFTMHCCLTVSGVDSERTLAPSHLCVQSTTVRNSIDSQIQKSKTSSHVPSPGPRPRSHTSEKRTPCKTLCNNCISIQHKITNCVKILWEFYNTYSSACQLSPDLFLHQQFAQW